MEDFAQALVHLIDILGYPGVFLCMFFGNTLVPIPVEVVMIPSGYLLQQRDMHLVPLVLAALAGDLGGSLFSYYAALHFGRSLFERYGRYVFFNARKIEMLDHFFARHGEISILTGRLTPGLRHFMAFPAGLSRMNVRKFALYTFTGGGIWMGVLLSVGYLIGGNKALVRHYLPYLTGAAVGAVAMLIVVYVLRHQRRKRRSL